MIQKTNSQQTIIPLTYSPLQSGHFPVLPIECCRDDIFLEANPEISITLIPQPKSQQDFPLAYDL